MSKAHFINKLMRHTRASNHTSLSIKTGLAPATICRLASGKRETLSLPTLEKISGRIGVKVSTLAAWWADEQPTVPSADVQEVVLMQSEVLTADVGKLAARLNSMQDLIRGSMCAAVLASKQQKGGTA